MLCVIYFIDRIYIETYITHDYLKFYTFCFIIYYSWKTKQKDKSNMKLKKKLTHEEYRKTILEIIMYILMNYYKYTQRTRFRDL